MKNFKKIILICFLFFFFSSIKTVWATELMTPYLQAVTKNSVYVMVEADNQTPITVQYGQTTAYGLTAQSSEAAPIYSNTSGTISSYIHKVKLTNLRVNTAYHYKTSQSSDYSFKTAPEAGAAFTFAWMSDIHGSNQAIHNQIVGAIKNFNPGFSLYGGDLAEDSYRFKTDFFLQQQLSLISRVPFFWTCGNHDVFRPDYQGFNMNNFLGYTRAPDSSSNSQQYYSFDYGDLHVLVLNYKVNHQVGSPQYIFSQNDLLSTNKKWKIVISHAPAYVYLNPEYGNDLDLRTMATNIFEPNGVDLVISGHAHVYQRNLVNRINHLIISPAGGGLRDPATSAFTQKSEKSFSFGIFEVTSTSLTMTAYKNTGEEIETLILRKPVVSPTITLTPTVTITPTPPAGTPSPPSSCSKKSSGDADCNNLINLSDFFIWRSEFLSPPTIKRADFDNNGLVNLSDFFIWRRGFLGQQ